MAARLGVFVLMVTMGIGTGCASSNPESSGNAPNTQPSVTVSPASSPPSIEPAPLKVSEEAACLELVPNLQRATDLVSTLIDNPDGSKSKSSDFRSAIGDLEHNASVAPAEMVPSINAQIETLEQLSDALTNGKDIAVDFQNFKSAGLNLATTCRHYGN